MEINEAAKSAYLCTLSPAKAEEFKKLSPEEQKKKITIFMEQNGPALTKTQPAVNKNKAKQPINMTGNTSAGSVGDEISFKFNPTNSEDRTQQKRNKGLFVQTFVSFIVNNLKLY